MAGDEFDAVIAAMDALPADASQVPDVVLANRIERLFRLRAMVDAAHRAADRPPADHHPSAASALWTTRRSLRVVGVAVAPGDVTADHTDA